MRKPATLATPLAILLLAACGSATTPRDGGEPPDAGLPELDAGADAGLDAGVDAGSKAEHCASVFGTELTNSYGRLDGTVVAVVAPADTQCALPNNDHVVVQLQMDGGVYRMVVNVLSTIGDPNVRFRTLDAPLRGGPWSEGWHTAVTLDYPTDLGVHTDAGFTPVPMAQLVPLVVAPIDLGAKVSIYGTSSGGASGHLIHRNGSSHDGAIVVNPESPTAHWLLFHFPQQSF